MTFLHSLFLCFVLVPQTPQIEDGDSIPHSERALVRACLEAYDLAWKSGEESKIVSLFCPKSDCLAQMRQEAQAFLRRNRVMHCASSLQFLAKAKTAQGTFWGAYAQTKLGYRPHADAEEPDSAPRFERMQQLDHFFLIRVDGDKGTILRVEEYDGELASSLRAEKLGCPACNYELTRPAGWFLLPRGRGWSPCTDSLTLLHPSGQVAADFDILECQEETPIEKVLEADQAHLAAACGTGPEQVSVASRKVLSPGDAQRGIEIEGILEQRGEEEGRKIRFLRVYYGHGPVLYTLNVYGEEKAFASLRGEIGSLRDSFRIVNPKLSLAELRETMKSRHNPGGKIERNVYANQQCGVRIQGPNGWKAEDFSGPSLFHVRFSAPNDPTTRISFHAMEDPNGWPDEASIQHALDRMIEKKAAVYGATTQPIAAQRSPHRGLQAFLYEAEWQWPGNPPVQERIGLLPAGRILYVVEMQAPPSSAEESGKTFRSVLDSLSRF